MQHFHLANPGLVTSSERNNQANYGLGALGARHGLVTTEYYETGPELGDIDSFKPSNWGVEVPEGAELFATTGGITPENARQFWVGWLQGRRVSMVALMQEHPVDAELAAEEVAIFPAVMDKAGVAALYSWRPAAQGSALWRHLFTGAIKTKPSVAAEALTEIPGHPVVSVVGAIPGEPTQHALIGWAEDTKAGAVLGIAVVRPDRLTVVRSEPIPDLSPFVHQRPGIWASSPPTAEGYELRLVLRSLPDSAGPDTYQTAKLSVGTKAENEIFHKVSLEAVGLSPGQLHAAAYDYVKDTTTPMANQAFLTKDGCLWFGPPPTLMKRGVSLDDPLAILTTRRAYWGERSADGSFSFQQLSPLTP